MEAKVIVQHIAPSHLRISPKLNHALRAARRPDGLPVGLRITDPDDDNETACIVLLEADFAQLLGAEAEE